MKTHPSRRLSSVASAALHTAVTSILLAAGLHAAVTPAPSADPVLATIPAGDFEMGDHHGFVDPKHGGDETPVHKVHVDAFKIGIDPVTNAQFAAFLNVTLAADLVEVRNGGVYPAGGRDLLCETRELSPYSRIGWENGKFQVLDGKELHPVVCIRWEGAAAYCNWLSKKQKLPVCYDTGAWTCDFSKSGYRLPTEAEWEYAARGGKHSPYQNFPWGDDADATRANWPESKNPFRSGPLPWTTPVGFFNGGLHHKKDFGWPAPQETWQSGDGTNGYGLHDMAGNVWQLVNDWYVRNYYEHSPANNPPGPSTGSPMPDGKPYRGMRGGNWYNGENGHSRVSNRNPSYWRGPQDPNHPYYHIGFRVALPIHAETRPAVALTDVPQTGGGKDNRPPGKDAGAPGGQPPPPADRRDAGDRAGRGFGNSPVSNAIDTDANGTINAAEISAAPKALRALDKNNDGTVTADEIGKVDDRGESAADGRPRSPAGPLMRFIDGDRDGNLTDTEINAASDSLKKADSNGDGMIVREEAVGRGGRNGGAPRPQPRGESPPPQDGPPPRDDVVRDTPAPKEPPGLERQRGQDDEKGERQGDGKQMHENKLPVSPNQGQTVGLYLNSPKACPGYTLMAPKHNTITYLLDNNGRIVNTWKSEYEPGQSAHLLPNGHLLRAGMLRVQGGTGGGEGGRIEEFDWDGKLLWEFDHATRDYQLHHDIKPLPNGNVLALMVERKSMEEAVAAGFDAEQLRDGYLVPDAVVEIQPVYPKGGKIIWEWHVWDHLIQNRDRTKANFGDPAAHPELIDVNCNGRATPAFWNHMNSLAYNAKLDQIVLSVRGCNEIWIIDHSTTTKEAASHNGGKQGKGGDLLYRWGNPAAYGRGTAADRQLIQQHDAEWVPDGFPGAGHITIFNNGYERGWSSLEEIVPPVDAEGSYQLAAGKAYGPQKPVWHYEAKNRTDFFSSEISGAHRLPNGNMLVCAGVVGHLFEVTPAGETVWQYVNPMVRNGILAQGETPGKDMRGHLWNAVFKVHRYAPDFPGLKGRDLTPKGVIELPASQKGKTGLDNWSEPARGNRPGTGGPDRTDKKQGGGNRPPREERREPNP